MDIKQSVQWAAQNLATTAEDALWAVNGQLRRVNIYRATEYLVASNVGRHANAADFMRRQNDGLPDFDTYDQDKDRPAWARRIQLCNMLPSYTCNMSECFRQLNESKIRELPVLHQTHRSLAALVGNRSGPDDCIAYMRRAALKIHPDKTSDLDGWTLTSDRFAPLKLDGTKGETAKEGAKNLYQLHQNLMPLMKNEYYRKALWQSAAAKGGTLTVLDLIRDLTVFSLLGASIQIFRKGTLTALLRASGLSYAVLLGAYLAQRWLSARKREQELLCRAVVVYKQKEGLKCLDSGCKKSPIAWLMAHSKPPSKMRLWWLLLYRLCTLMLPR